jgi:regulator of replication initiation timing
MEKNNMDRFDFEQQIMDCWRITDDIKQVSEGILEGDLNIEETANILIGLRQMYELKFNKLWDMFEGVIMPIVRENTMLNDECSALRRQLLEATEMMPVITTKKDKK